VALFCVTYDSGYDLYVQIKPHNLQTVWNGTAFVTYDVNDWSDYAIILTESTPGVYYGTWPAGISAGYYDLFVYIGLTPASTDSFAGSGTEYNGTTSTPSVPVYAANWTLKTPETADDTTETLYAAEGDVLPLAVDCGKLLQVVNGETVSTASFTTTTGVTIGTETAAGSLAVADFTTTTAGTYTITIAITLSGGSVINTTRTLVVT